ncbi:YqzG/YhdC family protein [Sporosarcina luteola]|uniref:DUF3889 domain-containing protein n=1 Tax=Sporosarcina luteola TaxID=582850 RepID=UPI00203BAB92|nr:DUF3889 domain-containing protein [Sporosarcina luteola]MCM3745554.1 YqzG/YhdC family protein [Sporosarcina luteola]
MKNLLITLGLMIAVPATAADITIPTQQHEQTPAYAKWGALAVKETKQKYPDANIVDYLHIGSETKDNTTIEKFKLWLKDDKHEFGVIIQITFSTKTDNIIKIDFQETDR